MTDPSAAELRRQEYDLRRRIDVLRLASYGDLEESESDADRLPDLEADLAKLSAARLRAEAKNDSGVMPLLSAQSTQLEASVELRMAHIPTGIVHLLDPAQHPLVTVAVRRTAGGIRRVRISASVEGYSAPAIDSLELNDGRERRVDLLPTFYPAGLREVTELTRATLSAVVEDLDNGRIEVHRTVPVWLLARNAAPLSVADPVNGARVDLTPYLGAFVTPNAPSVMSFLSKVAARHPDRRLVGYQGSAAATRPQVAALYAALGADAQVTYVNSVIAFDPEEGSASQRVRLPRESLADGQANCLDGTLLYASLLEAMSLRPAIVLVPGHSLVAWETWPESGEWQHLETTKTNAVPFETACQLGERVAARFNGGDGAEPDPVLYRRLELRTLRTERRITPVE